MKKIIVFALILIACASQFGCKKKDATNNNDSNSGPVQPLPYCDSTLWLRLDFNSNAYDSSCSRQNAIETNCTYVADRNGNPAKAISFNGTAGNNVSVTGNAKTRINFPFTISCWINPADSSQYNEIISSGVFTGTTSAGFKISIASGSITASYYNGSSGSTNYHIWTTHQIIRSKTWTHLTITFNGAAPFGKINMFTNGNSAMGASGVGAGTTIAYLTGDKLCIGPTYATSASSPLGIKVDKVKIWKKVLSQTEAMAEFNAVD